MSEIVCALLRPKAIGQDGSDLVFTHNGKQVDGSYFTHTFKDYVRLAGFDERLHVHSLFEVQKLLGHSSSEVTQIYSHLEPGQLHATANRIEVSLN